MFSHPLKRKRKIRGILAELSLGACRNDLARQASRSCRAAARRDGSVWAARCTHHPHPSTDGSTIRSAHITRCTCQSGSAAMGRRCFSRMGSRLFTVNGKNRIASWMSGARCSRFMIWVTRARPRRSPAAVPEARPAPSGGRCVAHGLRVCLDRCPARPELHADAAGPTAWPWHPHAGLKSYD